MRRSPSNSKNQPHLVLNCGRRVAVLCDWHVCPPASVRAAGGVSASSAFSPTILQKSDFARSPFTTTIPHIHIFIKPNMRPRCGLGHATTMRTGARPRCEPARDCGTDWARDCDADWACEGSPFCEMSFGAGGVSRSQVEIDPNGVVDMCMIRSCFC